MPAPRVFVSSTFIDLSEIRSQLCAYLEEYGFDPILSENNDIFYSPEAGAMDSCLESARNSDLFILIIGTRYGSIYDQVNSKSIVEAEYEAAQSSGVPIFTFVKRQLLDSLTFYNVNKDLVTEGLTFPGISNQEDAPKLFEFVDSITRRQKNNAVISFEYFSDIKEALRKQFAAYFLRLLPDNGRSRTRELLLSTLYDLEYEINEVTIEFDVRNSLYKIEFHKILRNVSGKPISQVLFHFLSNVYPQDPEQSYRHYLENPVFWSDLKVRAWDASGDLGLRLINDHGSRKDFLVIFQSRGVEIPILKHEVREFWYSYDVPFNLWGPYIDRPITFPTKMCKVTLIVPNALAINVGGFHVSPFRPKTHLEEKILNDVVNSTTHFSWSSDRLSIGDAYQIYWTDFIGSGYGRTDVVTTNQSFAKQ